MGIQQFGWVGHFTGAPVTFLLLGALLGGAGAGCSSDDVPEGQGGATRPEQEDGVDAELAVAVPSGSPAPVGLAIEIKNGAGVPLKVRAGQTFYLEQVDISTSVFSDVDEGVDGLTVSGDFATASWQGLAFEEEEFSQIPDAAAHFTRSRFYRGAAWMVDSSSLLLSQLDAAGHPLSAPIFAHVGCDDQQSLNDHFFVRRLRAIQWTRGCPSMTDCAGATDFEEEALVELRHARMQNPTLTLHPAATALELLWSANPAQRYVIPIEQIPSPPYAYGFSIDVEALTPPDPAGYYLPGQEITFRITLRDGAGTRLHPEGSLPSYNEVVFGPNEAGIQYFRGFFDPAWVYWRRKHRERTLIAHFMGPAQNVRAIYSIIPTEQILTEDMQEVGRLDRDGVFDVWKVFPTTNGVFGGAFDPTHAAWAQPGSDTFTVRLPDDAPAGTYRLTAKGRRTYHGEDIAFTRTLEVQVGSLAPTSTTLATGNCNTCHSGGGSLDAVLHRNPGRGTCYGCHAPLGLEYDAPVHVRMHMIHSRSNRFDAPIVTCAVCHLTPESIQRTSKSACLSCHKSYPEDHVAAYGPVRSIYIGGGAESFAQCSTSCHASHPQSGL